MQAHIKNLNETFEIGLALLFNVKESPTLLKHPEIPNLPDDNIYTEVLKCLVGKSKYTFAALIFYLVVEIRAFMPEHRIQKYVKRSEVVRQKFLVFVLFFC